MGLSEEERAELEGINQIKDGGAALTAYARLDWQNRGGVVVSEFRRYVKASDTKYESEFNNLVSQIIDGKPPEGQELGWLSNFIMETGMADLDDVVYDPDSLADSFFTDEFLIDAEGPEDPDAVSDDERLVFGRNFLNTLGDQDLESYSMLDPAVFEMSV